MHSSRFVMVQIKCARLITVGTVHMLKLISWNIAHKADAWRTVIDSDADIALLQEACEPPPDIASRFDISDIGRELWQTEGAGGKRPWRTAVIRLNPRVQLERIPTRTIREAASTDLAVSLLGTLTAAHVEDPDTGKKYTLVSMYAAWERPHASTESSWIYADASAHRLISDVSMLVGREKDHRIVAAGDMNICYDHGERGNPYWAARYRTIFDRFGSVGLHFVGPQYPDGRQADPWPNELPRASLNVPTFRTNRKIPTTATRQLDFVFASKGIMPIVKTRALNIPEEWGPSDHCRVRIEIG